MKRIFHRPASLAAVLSRPWADVVLSGAASADTLRSIIESVGTLVDEAKIKVTKDGIGLKAVDPAHVAMVELTLGKGAFDDFKGDDAELGVDLEEGLADLNASTDASVRPTGVAMTNPRFELDSRTPGVARAWRPRKPAADANASETRTSRASPCRVAASWVRYARPRLTSATSSTSQKWLG